MRPEILFPLFAPIDTLKGVGPRVAPLLAKLAGPIVRDVARDVGGKYSVETIADHRDEINTQIRARLAESFKELPFAFNDAALRKIDLPASIMEKIVAVQQDIAIGELVRVTGSR